MSIQVKIESIVRNLGGNIKFWQPLYEAIINSLEANSKNIEIVLYAENTLDNKNFPRKVTGFDVIDDGDGFTTKNCEAFSELWTDNKIKLGCKGSGRFTWLNVFSNINVDSYISSENSHVNFKFSLDFSEESIRKSITNCDTNKTIIQFRNITAKYYDEIKKRDNRPFVDLNELKQNLYDYLLIKLFLFKQKNIEFNITIKLDGKKERISNQDVEELKQKTFEIASDVFDVKYTFNLYYLFKRDGKNSKKIYYCSNYRSTKIIDDDSLGFSCSLPDKSSFVMLLTSNYLDDKDNDGRDDFTKLSNLRQATLDTPILISDINRETKKMMNEIIKEEYPELINYNNLEIQKAITKAPYLVDFIIADDDVVKSEKALITSANKKFNEAKTSTKIKFEKILKDRKIDTKEFDETLSSVTDIAVAELGEYILYRDNIIKGLELAIKDSAKKEEYIHNIFMLKNTVDDGKNNKHLLSNLWLLDDKFMSYVQAFSDKSIKNISEEDEKSKMIDISGILHRPDLTLFYSNSSNGKKDVVMIELKGANANKEEKKKAVTELPDDISILRDAMGEKVNVVWGYIITSIDEFLLRTLNTQDFRMLFATNGESKMYYKYYGNINAHIYVIDLQTICDDAFARNKTFLDILKKRADN